jgi:hypothetical protein
MSQRLAELHRQRQLVEEHLAWLNREIAAELIGGALKHEPAPRLAEDLPPAAPSRSATTTTAASADGAKAETSTTGATSAATPPVPDSSLSASLPPEALIDEYRTPPDALRDEVRKGCFLYLALAFGVLAVGIAVLYILFRL